MVWCLCRAPPEHTEEDAMSTDNWDGGIHHDRYFDLPDEEEDPDACTDPNGHSWAYTGTAYGGDDERWHGEGRCYCRHCGMDGDS